MAFITNSDAGILGKGFGLFYQVFATVFGQRRYGKANHLTVVLRRDTQIGFKMDRSMSAMILRSQG